MGHVEHGAARLSARGADGSGGEQTPSDVLLHEDHHHGASGMIARAVEALRAAETKS